jgi:hypothetical protein
MRNSSEKNPFIDCPPINHSNGDNYGAYLKNFQEKKSREPKPPPPEIQLQEMVLTQTVYEEIKRTIGNHPAERGGVLVCKRAFPTIDGYIFDRGALNTTTVYQLNAPYINYELTKQKVQPYGVVHSHKNLWSLSSQDHRAAWSNLTSPKNFHLNSFFMPIVKTIPDTGEFEIIPFIAVCNPKGNGEVDIIRPKLRIVNDREVLYEKNIWK